MGKMNRTISYIDVGLLSWRDKGRFMDFMTIVDKKVSIREKIDTWNKYAKAVKQHVFLTEVAVGEEESYAKTDH